MLRKLRNNFIALFFAFFACINNAPHLNAANGDIFSLQGAGTFNNVDVFRVGPDGSVYISSSTGGGATTTITNQGVWITSGTLQATGIVQHLANDAFGVTTAAISTITTTAGFGTTYTAFLSSGASFANATQGIVLCSTTTQNNVVTVGVCPAVTQSQGVVGVAVTAASTGAVVNMYTYGFGILALTTGTVNPGDLLAPATTSAGSLSTVTVAASTCAVAVALGIGNSAGGLLRVKWIH